MKLKVKNFDADGDGITVFDSLEDFLAWLNMWDSSLTVEVV